MSLYLPQSNAPCLNCTNREVGCHIVCERYREFAEFNRKRHEEARKREALENGLNEADILRNTRNKRL